MKAFPDPYRTQDPSGTDDLGLDLRDYFAAKAMQSIISKLPLMSETGNYGDKKPANEILALHGNVCHTAYKIADTMMNERTRK